MIDGFGIYGVASHLAGLALFVGGALIFFAYFLYRGLLGFDEVASEEMMRGDDHGKL